MLHIKSTIGVRDCPYGICCPWVCGGWDLDALGKFFRHRRRRRRPRLRAGGLRAGRLRAGGLRAGGLRAGGLKAGGLRAGGLRGTNLYHPFEHESHMQLFLWKI